ncbi:hypothetical protein [Pseudolactococcus carnosus]|uniref:Uncharacterized protein n=1 Tax=Pseudolactococcus carnosus TaxID=2749961 RepID=A0ABT0AVP6_9LACT|nr:hypothetical protein [Lactococcus carnosus]MCJ1979617.1 hypothetical protein [Lactococcus carnosus]MCJ1990635.1 hypothetical protein [Lactococcus carnosus]
MVITSGKVAKFAAATGMIASLVYIIYALVTNSADDLLLPILFSSSCGIALVSITGTDDAS